MEGVKHSLPVVANADLRYEQAKNVGLWLRFWLTYNLLGASLFQASCCLGGKSTGRCL